MITSHDANALYPIREVARLTGVKPITLRAWERRYELIEPVRTESGHRLYTQQHIDLLKQALKLVDDGIPISRVKSVLLDHNSLQAVEDNKQHRDQLVAGLQESLSQLQLSSFERLMDRLFADHSLIQLYRLAQQIDQQQQREGNALTQALWHTALTQRLQARLHQFNVYSLSASKRLYIHQVEQPAWLGKLVALFCYEQGYQPIHLDEAQPLAGLLKQAKTLHLHGLIVIDSHPDAATQLNQRQLGTLRAWLLGHDKIEEQAPPCINCELRAPENWFQPLNRPT
ncbi:MAG: MerR family transcriptional regulator [Thiomicrospira sp.]